MVVIYAVCNGCQPYFVIHFRKYSTEIEILNLGYSPTLRRHSTIAIEVQLATLRRLLWTVFLLKECSSDFISGQFSLAGIVSKCTQGPLHLVANDQSLHALTF